MMNRGSSLASIIVTFWFVLLSLWTLETTAAANDRKSPPDTHRLQTIRPSVSAAWFFRGDSGKGASSPAPLYILSKKGGLYTLKPGKGSWALNRIPGVPRMSAMVPPLRVGKNQVAGVTKDGALRIVGLPKGETKQVGPTIALSPISRPTVLTDSAIAAVGRDGSLLLFRKIGSGWQEFQRISADKAKALRDGVLTAADLDGDGRNELIVPASPSTRYGHGVLGDGIEPTEIRAYQFSNDGLRLLATYAAKNSAVFEALGTQVADLDGDGKAEILVTQSDDSNGAMHLALALRGGKLIRKAAGQAIGQGNRWSHLLGGFDLPPHGKRVLAIETPHLAGYLLALRLKGTHLSEQARRPGFTTHGIGSRNLWEFTVMRRGGASEVVLQEVGHGRLTALALQMGGRWEVRWTIPLSGAVNSNLLAGDFNGDGREDLVFSDYGGRIHLLLSN